MCLEFFEPPVELVVSGVGEFGRRINILEAVVVLDFAAQLRDFFSGGFGFHAVSCLRTYQFRRGEPSYRGGGEREASGG